MKKNKKRKLYNILRLLWIATAFAAVVLSVVYFIKIDEIDDSNRHQVADDGSAVPSVSPDITQQVSPGPSVPAAVPGISDAPVEATPTAAPTGIPAPTPTEVPLPTPTEAPLPTASATIDNTKPMLALTFDDGPSDAATRRILEALAKYNVKATFFLVGYNIDRLPDIVEEIYTAGHQLANHTDNHVDLSKSNSKKRESEVWGNNDKINKIVSVGDTLLRPPYGAVSDKMKETVNTPMINWTVDSLDWKSRDCDKVVEEIMSHVKDGYIVLMHDLYVSTAEAVEVLIPKLLDEGYQLVTVNELFEARGVELKNGNVYRSCTPTPMAEKPLTPTPVPKSDNTKPSSTATSDSSDAEAD